MKGINYCQRQSFRFRKTFSFVLAVLIVWSGPGAGFVATSRKAPRSTVDNHLPLEFDREALEAQYETELKTRWTQVLKESAPFVQQAAQLWVSGQLRRDDPSLATACRQTLTKLGPAFVKLGQILSVREDILGPVWSTELALLQNSVQEFGGREAVDEALATPNFENKLIQFDPTPVAVASIAQVHKGIWLDEGNTTIDVAIKVLRPNVARQVGIDLCVLIRAGDILAEWAPRILPVSRVDWQALLRGLAQGLWEEVDLAGEAQRQIRFGQNMELVPRVFVPQVHAYNRNVLVSGWVDGTPLRSIPSGDDRLKDAQALMRDAYCQSMYVDAFFHADGHGGNLLWVLEGGGQLCILDCGLMVDIEPARAEGLLRLSLHLASRDWTRVVDDVIALGFLPQNLPPQLKAEARGIARRIIGPYLDVGGGAKAASAYSVSSLFDDVSSATLNLPTSLPPDMILLARAVIQLEGLALRAYPDYRLVDDILPVAARIALRSTPAASNSQDDDTERATLLLDLLYEGDVFGEEEKTVFSPERLLRLLDTARGGRNDEPTMSMEEVVQELLQADAARNLVAQETFNFLDAMIRDTVWRGLDTVAERLPPFLAQSPARKTLETMAPRISEKEQLIVLRLVEVLKEMGEGGREKIGASTAQWIANNQPSLFRESPLVQVATIPGVGEGIRDIAVSAVLWGDDNARSTVDAVSEKMRECLQARLVRSGASNDVALTMSNALVQRPWKRSKE